MQNVFGQSCGRFNSKRERTKLKRALKTAEYLERQALKNARNKAFEDEEAKKIPYEVRPLYEGVLEIEYRTAYSRS